MTQAQYTHIAMVVDRSGSMQSLVNDTIGGYNALMKSQREFPGRCTVSLQLFDHEHLRAYTFRDIKEVPDLDRATYVPRGSTALLDAIGTEIDVTGGTLYTMPEANRPDKVIIGIITDGQENASCIRIDTPPFTQGSPILQLTNLGWPGALKYTKENLQRMIKHQQEVYKWEFLFLGANIDAIATASSVGIWSGNAMTFAANNAGTSSAYGSTTKAFTKMRSGVSGQSVGVASFDDEDRTWQKDAGLKNP
jgi:hypothetical protein